MHGDEPEVLDGTQLAADWTFSGLQKFGQGLMDRLRGQKLPNKLLERVSKRTRDTTTRSSHRVAAVAKKKEEREHFLSHIISRQLI